MQAKQHTLARPITLTGVGLHTGKMAELCLSPAAENTGILFRRIDCDPVVTIPATTAHVSDTRFNTCIEKAGVSVFTVEHILSALAGMEIDNVCIDINTCEPPAMDGSAYLYAQAILSAGIVEQAALKRFLQVKRVIQVESGDAFVKLAPYIGFKMSIEICYNHPIMQHIQPSFTIDFAKDSYIDTISRARTFGFLSDYEKLRANQLALGADLNNTWVLDDTTLLNTDSLSDNAAFVKHKLLDALGDLFLLGYPLKAEFTGYKSGHALNHALRQALLSAPDAWELT